MTGSSGKFLNNENFCGMIENLGDAYEAAEQCYGMVWWLAMQLAATQVTGRPDRRQLLAVIAQAQDSYREGLRAGGVQKSR